jgi:hypothetical protein
LADISRLVLEIDAKGVTKATGDLTAFERLMSKIQGTSTKTEKLVKDLGNNFAAFNLIINRLPGPLKDIASGMLGMVSPATAATGAIISLSSAAIQFGKNSLQAFGEFELIRANLELTMGSVERANDVFSQVKDFAMKTPFDVAGTAQAVNMLKQAGIATNDLISTLEILGNVSGGNMERFNRIAYNYVQVLQKGVLDARDTREFAGNLVPINKALEAIGVTGKATADDMVRAFQHMTQEGSMFYNAINRQSDTMVGKTNQLKEAWANFQATWAENSGLGELWKKVIEGITGAIQDQTDTMNKNKAVREAYERINSVQGDHDRSRNDLRSLRTKRHVEVVDNGTPEDHLLVATRELLVLQNQLNQARSESVRGILRTRIRILEEEIIKNQELSDSEKNRIENEEAINSLLKEQDRLREEGKTQFEKEMSDLLGEYANTSEGKYETILKAIQALELLKSKTYEVEHIASRGRGGQVKWLETIGLSKEQIAMVDAVILKLTGDLNKVEEELRETKTSLKEWQELLKSTLNISEESAFTGLTAVDEYTTGFYDRLKGALAYATIAGEDAADVYGEFADEIDRAMKALMYSGKFNATDNAIKGLAELYAIINGSRGNKTSLEWSQNATEERDRQLARILMANANTYDDKLKLSFAQSKIHPEMQGVVAQQFYTANYSEKKDDLTHQLDLMKMSTAERERQLLIDQGIHETYVDEILSLQKQIDTYQILGNLLDQIGQTSLSSLIDMAHELGEAFQDGTISSNELGDAVGNMVKRIVDALPQLLLSAGIQLMSKDWRLGLAFIAASGLASFVSGLISDTSNDKNDKDDQLSKLQKIQDEISNLIDQQKSLEEYYFKKRQELNARAAMGVTSVNDMILTPQGNFSTNPNDYIIATKHPETLGAGNASVSVPITIVNNAGVSVTKQEQEGPDGKKILIMIDNMIKGNIANGNYDSALQAQQRRIAGRNIRTS